MQVFGRSAKLENLDKPKPATFTTKYQHHDNGILKNKIDWTNSLTLHVVCRS
ncbi:hypothetical protein COCC4DRAFT_32632, partial [Bipolaris maydis ATCC 48331]